MDPSLLMVICVTSSTVYSVGPEEYVHVYMDQGDLRKWREDESQG